MLRPILTIAFGLLFVGTVASFRPSLQRPPLRRPCPPSVSSPISQPVTLHDQSDTRQPEFRPLVIETPLKKDVAGPPALVPALDIFQKEPDENSVKGIAEDLILSEDPHVETTALIVTHTQGDLWRRCLALQILSARSSPYALQAAVDILSRETHPELLEQAIFALPDAHERQTLPQERQAVLSCLSRAILHVDAKVRAVALLKFGEWGGDPNLLAHTLTTDPSAQVREAAALAFVHYRPLDPIYRDLLAVKMNDSAESGSVRESSRQAYETVAFFQSKP